MGLAVMGWRDRGGETGRLGWRDWSSETGRVGEGGRRREKQVAVKEKNGEIGRK